MGTSWDRTGRKSCAEPVPTGGQREPGTRDPRYQRRRTGRPEGRIRTDSGLRNLWVSRQRRLLSRTRCQDTTRDLNPTRKS